MSLGRKDIFNATAAGDYFVVPPYHKADMTMILLHGAGTSAEHMRPAARKFHAFLPNCTIIVPNGDEAADMNQIPPEHHYDARKRGAFNWTLGPNDDAPGGGFFNTHREAIEEECKTRPVFLLGFSMGGFKASEEYLARRDLYAAAVLHSSALVMPVDESFPEKDRPVAPEIFTLAGIEDEYLRPGRVPGAFKAGLANGLKMTFMRAAAPVMMGGTHMYNSYKLNRAGISTRTRLTTGIPHHINDRSVGIVTDHIRKLSHQLA